MNFTGGSVGRTPPIHCRGHRFDPWVRELRSHMPLSLAKKVCFFFFKDKPHGMSEAERALEIRLASLNAALYP